MGSRERTHTVFVCMRIMRELVDQWQQTEDTTELNHLGEDEVSGDQNLARQMGWCPIQNEWVTRLTGGGNGLMDQDGTREEMEDGNLPFREEMEDGKD